MYVFTLLMKNYVNMKINFDEKYKNQEELT